MSFSDAQKALLPLACLPCALICFLFYRYGKKPILNEQQTMERRLLWFYPLIASLLLGEFFFQAVPNSTGDTSFVSAFVMLGFFLVFCVQKMGRVWHENPFYVSPNQSYLEIRNIVDLKSMEVLDYRRVNLSDEDEENSAGNLTAQDEDAELRRRRFIVYLTFAVLSVMCLLQGFFLLHSPWNSWVVTVFFVLDKCMETVIVCVGFLHAFLHAPSENERGVYAYLSVLWFIFVGVSPLGVCLGMKQAEGLAIITHLATRIFYALAGGVLFWIALYYLNIDQRKTDRKESCIYLVVFGVGACVSWVIGFFY